MAKLNELWQAGKAVTGSTAIRDWVYANLETLERKYPDRAIMVLRSRRFLFFKRLEVRLFDSDIEAMKKKIELYQKGIIDPEDAIIVNFKKST